MRNEFQLAAPRGAFFDYSCAKQTRALQGCALSPIAPHTHNCNPRHRDNRCKICRQQQRATKQGQEFISGKEINNPGEWRAENNLLLGGVNKTKVLVLFFFFFVRDEKLKQSQTLVSVKREAEAETAQTDVGF